MYLSSKASIESKAPPKAENGENGKNNGDDGTAGQKGANGPQVTISASKFLSGSYSELAYNLPGGDGGDGGNGKVRDYQASSRILKSPVLLYIGFSSLFKSHFQAS